MSNRRDHILDAARDLIVRDGYPNASMHAIARAAGTTRPALYAEFADRDELFAALLDREEERALMMAAASVPEVPPGADLAEVAADSADIFLDIVLAAPETWRFVLLPGEGMPPEAHQRVRQGRNIIRERTEALLGLMAALRGQEIDAELVGHTVIAISEAVARMVLAEDGPARRDAVAATMRWLARRAVAAAATGKVDRAESR